MKRMTLAAASVVALILLTVGAPDASAQVTFVGQVPDGGSTVMLLGGALGCLEVLRRKLHK